MLFTSGRVVNTAFGRRGLPSTAKLVPLVMTEFLFQGAEARVYTTSFMGTPAVLKERLSKSYRVQELDKKINKQRLLQEARCIVKCRRAGVACPAIYLVDLENFRLYMEKIDGRTVKDLLWAAAKEESEGKHPHQFLLH
jgi:Kae1-associated kinase Bud32